MLKSEQLEIIINPTLVRMAEYFCEVREISLSEWVNEKLEVACHQEQKEMLYNEFLNGTL